MCPSGGSELVRSKSVTGVQLASNKVSWPPFCLVLSALAALFEPIWAPRWPSELLLALCTSKMNSNLHFRCPSRAFQTFKKCGRVIKI